METSSTFRQQALGSLPVPEESGAPPLSCPTVLSDAGVASATPILDDAAVARRKSLLAELQAGLAGSGFECVLAGRQRLVLRYSEPPPHAPSGPTNPALHITSPAPDVVTTDGACYRLRDGREFPVTDVSAAVAAICGALEPAIRA
jgi:hypothetical protein